jgi:HK97 family phage major capsid protein
MSSRIEHVRALRDRYKRSWEAAKEHLDDCARRHPTQPMSGEEQQKYDRQMAELDGLAEEIRVCEEREEREREAGVAREAFDRRFGLDASSRADTAGSDLMRRFIEGQLGEHLDIPVRAALREKALIRAGADANELRVMNWDTDSGGSLVATTLARTLVEYLEASSGMLRAPTYRLNTSAGNPMNVPTVASHAIATQVSGQGTAFAGTDPEFGRDSLNVFKYGEIVRCSDELLTDSEINVAEFVLRNVGRAIGRQVDTALVVGNGTTQPEGLMTALASGGAGSVHTGGSLINPSFETLIDTVHTVADEYRLSRSAGWLFRDATVAGLRKLREDAGGTTGAFLWQPSQQVGQPDTLLGYPLLTSPNVASLASNARIGCFVDFSCYWMRHVGDVRLERDNSVYFASDEVALRGKWRVGGALVDPQGAASVVRNV